MLVVGGGPRSRLLELGRKVLVLVVENIGTVLKVIVALKLTTTSPAMVMMSPRKERG